MSDISRVDKNFAVSSSINKDDVIFRNALDEPFKIYGVYYENDRFRRLPESVAASTNDGVLTLSTHTAGGRLRFITDSNYVAIKTRVGESHYSPKMAPVGVTGFDMYERLDGREQFVASFIPPQVFEDAYESVFDFLTGSRERLITIDFPLYNEVYDLYVGLEKGASLKPAPEYTYSTPFVYYGSSVTQGGCASRPGNCFQGFVSRHFDADYINLGFSGSARGEAAIRDYIAELDMSIFILDYDHNSPTYETLVETHEPFYRAVRAKHPTLPIILTTKPNSYLRDVDVARKDFIESSYKRWCEEGDENLYFISGPELMALAGDEGTIDRIHPNDLGFYSMAQGFIGIIEKILKK